MSIEEGNIAGSDLSFFIDKEEVIHFIQIISRSADILECCEAFDKKYEWLVLTMSKYQEQPMLLNSSLSDLITPLADRMLTITFSLDLRNDEFSQVDYERYFKNSHICNIFCININKDC